MIRISALNYEWALKELLAVVHRDGGHYTEKHGIQKSFEDAMKLSSERIGYEDDYKSRRTNDKD